MAMVKRVDVSGDVDRAALRSPDQVQRRRNPPIDIRLDARPLLQHNSLGQSRDNGYLHLVAWRVNPLDYASRIEIAGWASETIHEPRDDVVENWRARWRQRCIWRRKQPGAVAKQIERSKHETATEPIPRVTGHDIADHRQTHDRIIRTTGIAVGEVKTGLTGKKAGNSRECHSVFLRRQHLSECALTTCVLRVLLSSDVSARCALKNSATECVRMTVGFHNFALLCNSRTSRYSFPT